MYVVEPFRIVRRSFDQILIVILRVAGGHTAQFASVQGRLRLVSISRHSHSIQACVQPDHQAFDRGYFHEQISEQPVGIGFIDIVQQGIGIRLIPDLRIERISSRFLVIGLDMRSHHNGRTYDSGVLGFPVPQLGIIVVEPAHGQVQSHFDIRIDLLIDVRLDGIPFQSCIFDNSDMVVIVERNVVDGIFGSSAHIDIMFLYPPVAGDQSQPVGSPACSGDLLVRIGRGV